MEIKDKEDNNNKQNGQIQYIIVWPSKFLIIESIEELQQSKACSVIDFEKNMVDFVTKLHIPHIYVK